MTRLTEIRPTCSIGPRRGGSRRGTALVEFAVLTPLVLTLVVGMMEVSRAMMVKEQLNNAARKACNLGIKANMADTDMKAAVTNILVTDDSYDSTKITTNILVNGATYSTMPVAGDKISVQVSMPVSAVFWAGTWILPGTDIESETVVMMRQE